MRNLTIVALALLAATTTPLAQGTEPPTNNLPNPYRTIANAFKLPDGREWGSTSAVEIDKDGRSIWVAERCGANSCAASNLPSILKFDASGTLVKSFGAGLLLFPHGIFVDRDGNVWVTDGQDDAPRAQGTAANTLAGPPAGATKGSQVFKFSPDGKLLLTLGTRGGAAAPGFFYQPNDVLVAPNGTIFVSEGHGGANSRILKFSRDGKLLKTWGTKGSGDGQLDGPHALAMDSRGRLFVGDRSNNRIVIFDQEGRQLAVWRQFSRPSGIYIDKRDVIYVADSESESVSRNHDGWKRGIRIGSARDGSVTAFIPDPVDKTTGTSAAEGVAADADGNIYGAEVGPKGVKKYIRAGAVTAQAMQPRGVRPRGSPRPLRHACRPQRRRYARHSLPAIRDGEAQRERRTARDRRSAGAMLPAGRAAHHVHGISVSDLPDARQRGHHLRMAAGVPVDLHERQQGLDAAGILDGRFARTLGRRHARRRRHEPQRPDLVRHGRQLPQQRAARDRALHDGRCRHDPLPGDHRRSEGLHAAVDDHRAARAAERRATPARIPVSRGDGRGTRRVQTRAADVVPKGRGTGEALSSVT